MTRQIDLELALFAGETSGLPELAESLNLRLDEGLMETFPASDPVSVAQID